MWCSRIPGILVAGITVFKVIMIKNTNKLITCFTTSQDAQEKFSDWLIAFLAILESQGVHKISIFIYLPDYFPYLFAVFSNKIFQEKNLFFAVSVSTYLVWTQRLVLRSYLVSFGFGLDCKKYILQMWLCLFFDRWVHLAFLFYVFWYFGFQLTTLNSFPLLEWLCHLWNSDLN